MRTRILIAEDEPQMGRLLQAGLSARGYEVNIATDGQQALDVGAVCVRRAPDKEH